MYRCVYIYIYIYIYKYIYIYIYIYICLFPRIVKAIYSHHFHRVSPQPGGSGNMFLEELSNLVLADGRTIQLLPGFHRKPLGSSMGMAKTAVRHIDPLENGKNLGKAQEKHRKSHRKMGNS